MSQIYFRLVFDVHTFFIPSNHSRTTTYSNCSAEGFLSPLQDLFGLMVCRIAVPSSCKESTESSIASHIDM